MSLQAALTLFLEEYPEESDKPFADNALASFVRHEVPTVVEGAIDGAERFKVTGSAGITNWARVPWVAVMDPVVTTSAQRGYYVVYLVREDFSGIYLSLNQGVTTVHEEYGARAHQALRARGAELRARAFAVPSGFSDGSIDLRTRKGSKLGRYYESGSVISKYYERDVIPDDDELTDDLNSVLKVYREIIDRELIGGSSTVREDDEVEYEIEDLTALRTHKRIERNARLAEKAKKAHGYVCEACGFDFSKKYGALGEGYIEAHHLIPLSELKGSKRRLSPKADFAVLCANCHRMIHRSDYTSDVKLFRERIIVKPK